MTNSDGVSHTYPSTKVSLCLTPALRLAGRDLAEHLTKILTERGCALVATAEREFVPDVIEEMFYIVLANDTELKSTAEINEEKPHIPPQTETSSLPRRTLPLRRSVAPAKFLR